MATKVREYLNLQKDRKSNDAVKEEKLLMKLLTNPGRSKLEEYLAMERIVGLLKIITGKNGFTQPIEFSCPMPILSSRTQVQ